MMPQLVHINEKEWTDALSQNGAAWLDYLCGQMVRACGGALTAESMASLTTGQITVYVYKVFRDEMLEGGFCQLIQNGYGPFVFENPFAQVLRLWGMKDLHKIISKANAIYRKNKADLTRERTEDEFMAMYETYEAFDKWEDDYVENEEAYTDAMKHYVTGHPGEFYVLE